MCVACYYLQAHYSIRGRYLPVSTIVSKEPPNLCMFRPDVLHVIICKPIIRYVVGTCRYCVGLSQPYIPKRRVLGCCCRYIEVLKWRTSDSFGAIPLLNRGTRPTEACCDKGIGGSTFLCKNIYASRGQAPQLRNYPITTIVTLCNPPPPHKYHSVPKYSFFTQKFLSGWER